VPAGAVPGRPVRRPTLVRDHEQDILDLLPLDQVPECLVVAQHQLPTGCSPTSRRQGAPLPRRVLMKPSVEVTATALLGYGRFSPWSVPAVVNGLPAGPAEAGLPTHTLAPQFRTPSRSIQLPAHLDGVGSARATPPGLQEQAE